MYTYKENIDIQRIRHILNSNRGPGTPTKDSGRPASQPPRARRGDRGGRNIL